MNREQEKFSELVTLLNSEWQPVKNDDGIITEKKQMPGSNIACFKSYGHIDADPDELFDYVYRVYDSQENMKEHDSDVTEYEIIEKFKENDARICYQVNSLTWPLWSRDLVYYQTTRQVDDEYWLCMYSIESDKKPEQKDKFVRAQLNISAYGFIPDDDGTAVYRIAHVDPCGSIPAAVVNSYANKTTSMIKELKKNFSD